MPDDIVRELQLDGHSALVALTHDPKLDDLALMEALKSAAFYVGAIGSNKNNDARRERLKEFDVSADQNARPRGPVGPYIGSDTPPPHPGGQPPPANPPRPRRAEAPL